MPLRRLETISDLLADYDTVLCDVWGVLHNGVTSFAPASAALKNARENGVKVVLITNSPRPNDQVITQLGALGVDDEAWDAVVTSGDVTRKLISDGTDKVFHLGPERDYPLFGGLDVQLVDEAEATTVVCTGLFDDEEETPENYAPMLKRLQARNLPFICANPDIVVERGDRLIWCAGALARDYAALGGPTLIAGKPYHPIYERAFEIASDLHGKSTNRASAIAIGDGMPTDVKGAMDADLDLLFISDGIHAREYGEPGKPDMARLETFLNEFGAAPVATMPRLA